MRSDAARTMERFMDEGTHVLVSSAKNMGEAAAVLPVISTLSFGFAAGELLGQDASSHAAVLLLLALSASFSLFATTYSVLESYYISMLTASDTRSHYAYGVCDRERASSTSQRDELARVIVDFLQGFEPWRQRARDALWLSVILILAACGCQTACERGVSVASVGVGAALLGGAVSVPRTVLKFRRRFVPLLQAYRELQALQREGGAGGGFT